MPSQNYDDDGLLSQGPIRPNHADGILFTTAWSGRERQEHEISAQQAGDDRDCFEVTAHDVPPFVGDTEHAGRRAVTLLSWPLATGIFALCLMWGNAGVRLWQALARPLPKQHNRATVGRYHDGEDAVRLHPTSTGPQP